MGRKNHHKNIDIVEVMDFVMEVASVMILNGAEIFRIEETITHICNHYDVKEANAFVMSNGVFISAKINDKESYSGVKHIPLTNSHLGVITAINDLSRNICFGQTSLGEAKETLSIIKKMPMKPKWFRMLAAGYGSAGFCYLMGASFLDTCLVFVIAMLLYIFILFCEKHQLSKVIENTVGGGIACGICVVLYGITGNVLDFDLNKVIIGSILPMFPGLVFVNSVRDVANSDILSGIIKMTNALLVFVYVAIGVGVVLSASASILGIGGL